MKITNFFSKYHFSKFSKNYFQLLIHNFHISFCLRAMPNPTSIYAGTQCSRNHWNFADFWVRHCVYWLADQMRLLYIMLYTQT